MYVTSQPIPPFVMDYYLHFLAGIPASHAASRAHPALRPRRLSARPHAEDPRAAAAVEKIRAAIPDLSRAYMTVFRASPLERRLATLLDIPLNAADPELESLCTKSSGRRVLREAGVDVPLGFEDLRDEDDLVTALQGFMAQRPGLRRARAQARPQLMGGGPRPRRPALASHARRVAAGVARDCAGPTAPTALSYLERFGTDGRDGGGVRRGRGEGGQRPGPDQPPRGGDPDFDA